MINLALILVRDMKRSLSAILLVLAATSVFGQIEADIMPYSTINDHIDFDRHLHHIRLEPLDMVEVEKEDGVAKDGSLWHISRYRELNANLNNSGTWTDVDGGKLWRLMITAKDAIATSLYYDKFYLPEGSTMHVYNADRSEQIGAFTSSNNKETGVFATGIVRGESMIIEYYEPHRVAGKGIISIEQLAHYYRGVEPLKDEVEGGGSGSCQIDVRCPEGDEWGHQIDATVRILVADATGTGWCTGTVVNNTNVDCTPYILTAWHCADNSTTSHFNSFVFYFRRQVSGCGSGALESTVSITGCTMRSHSGNGSTLGSDYLLVELNSSIPSNYFAYYAGWNKGTAAASDGVCIHHPSGDNKKISTYCNSPTSTSWQFGPSGTHWNVQWCSTVTDHGVTEGGSSGSGLWNQSGYLVGQLTGGGSFCTSPFSLDKYGKMSYNWQSNSIVTGGHLRSWLDPLNTLTSVNTFDGTYWPCLNDIAETVLQDQTSVYPNPSTGVFNIITKQALDELEVTVFDGVGKIIQTMSMNGLHVSTIDLSNYSNGMYYIRLTSGGTSVTKKINVSK